VSTTDAALLLSALTPLILGVLALVLNRKLADIHTMVNSNLTAALMEAAGSAAIIDKVQAWAAVQGVAIPAPVMARPNNPPLHGGTPNGEAPPDAAAG
jgi:preprotein translocase subunit SecG